MTPTLRHRDIFGPPLAAGSSRSSEPLAFWNGVGLAFRSRFSASRIPRRRRLDTAVLRAPHGLRYAWRNQTIRGAFRSSLNLAGGILRSRASSSARLGLGDFFGVVFALSGLAGLASSLFGRIDTRDRGWAPSRLPIRLRAGPLSSARRADRRPTHRVCIPRRGYHRGLADAARHRAVPIATPNEPALTGRAFACRGGTSRFPSAGEAAHSRIGRLVWRPARDRRICLGVGCGASSRAYLILDRHAGEPGDGLSGGPRPAARGRVSLWYGLTRIRPHPTASEY